MKIWKGLRQAYDVQNFTHEALMRIKSQVDQSGLPITREDAQSIAQLTKAWVDAQERIRIHKGKPLPGSVQHEKKSKSKPKVAGTIMPMPAPDEQAPDEQASGIE